MLKLDDRDLQILSVLGAEGRISKTELAERINLSPSPCWERLKRLEKAGMITGYHAEFALKKIASHITVFVTAELADHTAASFQTFERIVRDMDEVTGCWALGGGFDYLLEIVTRDIDRYQRLVDELLTGGAGLKRYYTYVVTKAVKRSHAPPFAALLDLATDENLG
jgi:Lrp/AsnC family transcriptional regulator, regulator of ectoine-degradation genes